MVNFSLLAAEIVSLVWGTPANFNSFCVLASLLHSMGDFIFLLKPSFNLGFKPNFGLKPN